MEDVLELYAEPYDPQRPLAANHADLPEAAVTTHWGVTQDPDSDQADSRGRPLQQLRPTTPPVSIQTRKPTPVP